jgi:hypothetical protein
MLELIMEPLLRLACFPVGWVIMKVITLGNWQAKSTLWDAHNREDRVADFLGLGFWVIVLSVLFIKKLCVLGT